MAVEAGAWFKNFNENPALWAFPVLAVVGALLNVVASKANRCGFAFFFSVLTMAGVIITAVVSMFPFVMPSSTHPEQSLLMWDATSSELTLTLMFYLALVFVHTTKCLVAWMKALLKTTKTHYTKEKQYVICNLGSGCVGCSYGEC